MNWILNNVCKELPATKYNKKKTGLELKMILLYRRRCNDIMNKQKEK